MIAKEDKALVVVCVVLLVLSMAYFSILKSGEDDTEEESVEQEGSSADAMLGATRSFLASGTNTMITADALYANLNDGYTGNDPFILSVRSESQYEVGHIPGAVNIPWTSVFTEENISKLPANRQIVVYCYTGHTASQITALLNVYDYDAVCLKWGMCSWTTNATVTADMYYTPPGTDLPTVSGDDPGTWSSGRTRCGGGDPAPAPEPVESDAGDGEEVDLRADIHSSLASGKSPAVSAADLYANLNDGDAGNDPFVLSIRSASQYAIGHIPGAVNIGFTSLFTDENLSKLPDDGTQIVVACYTGHTASQATALLNANGYNAIALKWGMSGWTSNATIAPSGFNKAKDAGNYPVSMGPEQGELATAVVADTASVVLDATNAFLGAGKTTMTTAEALYNNLNDNYASNDPFILSIRSAAQYEMGHIPGAVNIPFAGVFAEDSIAQLPTNRQIVVYCYTGHTASQTTAMLNVLGYDAVCLKWGMCSWTTNATVAPGAYDPGAVPDHPVAAGAEPGTFTRNGCGGDTSDGGGTVEEAEAGSVFDIARVACNNYLAEGKPAAVAAGDLHEKLNNEDASDDPFVLSIRSSAQYETGHIPGAVNMAFGSLFSEEGMAGLPTDRQIVVVCYTGHTASQAAALLNINGYDAVPLKWGMTGWTTDPAVAPSAYNKGSDAHNYPVSIGSECGDIGSAQPVSPTDEEILRDAALAYLSGGARFISAPDLYALLDDGDAGNDPYVLSIRSSAHYELGHIPGAVNIPWRSLFSLENLSKLPGDDTQVVVVCYTGQTASQMTALLNVLGYNASTLLHGMASWTLDTTISPGRFDSSAHQSSYPTSSGEEPGSIETATRNGCGGDEGGGTSAAYAASADEWEVIRQACERYVNEVRDMYITAGAVYNNLDDGYATNDPYIISLRSAEHYAAGHLPGAVNIAAGSLFTDGVLSTLPADGEIVVYCYTGQGACHAAALLNIAGYETYSLKFGMCSWTDDPDVNMNKCYTAEGAGHDYRTLSGTEPGEWA